MKRINIAKARVKMMQFLETADEAYAMKRLQVRIHHSTHPPFKFKICPGTKVSDVLAYINLTEDYVLSPLSDPQKHYTSMEGLYDLIKNDEKLIAKLSPDAKRRYANLFMQEKENQKVKRIAIKVLGSEAEPLDIILQEGVTVREVLKATGLTNHSISLWGSHVFLSPEEILYDKVNDGDKIYASLPVCEVY